MIRVELTEVDPGHYDFTGPGLGDQHRTIVWLPAIPAPGHVLDLGSRGGYVVAPDPAMWRPHEGGCTVTLIVTRSW